MWKRMAEADTIIGALALMVVSWAAAWLLVYKLGWRYSDWLEFSGAPFSPQDSCMAYAVIISVLLSPAVGLLVVVRRLPVAPNR